MQMAFAQLWISYGVCPSAVIDQSPGVHAAPAMAGVILVSDAIFLIGTRAQILEHTETLGHMLRSLSKPLSSVLNDCTA